MPKHSEPLMVQSTATFQALENACLQAFAGWERLIDLNLNDSKTLLLEYVRHVQSVATAADLREMVNLQAELCESVLEKSVAYGQHLYTLIADGGAEFS